MTALERAVSANFTSEPMWIANGTPRVRNAVVTGRQPGRAVAEKPNPIFVHPAQTTAPCVSCGKSSTQLLSKSKSGPWHASCSSGKCMNAVSALVKRQ